MERIRQSVRMRRDGCCETWQVAHLNGRCLWVDSLVPWSFKWFPRRHLKSICVLNIFANFASFHTVRRVCILYSTRLTPKNLSSSNLTTTTVFYNVCSVRSLCIERICSLFTSKFTWFWISPSHVKFKTCLLTQNPTPHSSLYLSRALSNFTPSSITYI